MPLVLGIDVGTTAARATICDGSHNIVSSGSSSYGLIPKPDGRVEQDAEELWKAAVAAARQALQAVPTGDVKALSLSTQGGTLIPADKDGSPLRNAISWLDQRAVAQAATMAKRIGHEFFYRKTGFRLFGGLPFLQILWIRDNEPDLFKSAARFLTVAGFLNMRLTGRPVTDPTNASLSSIYDIVSRQWSPDLLGILGISEDRLASLAESGTPIGKLKPKAAQDLGLPKTVLVVSGGLDQYCAALGAGAFNLGDCLLSCGTAWALLFTVERLLFDVTKHLFPGPHLLPDRLGLMTSIPTAGAVLEWLKENFGGKAGEDFFQRCDEAASDLPPGSQKLLFFPHFIGAITPTARGAIFGMTLTHDDRAIYRAILEGIAFEARWRIEEIASLGVQAKRLTMIGGGARSPLWRKIVADLTGLPVYFPGRTETASLGAALLAAVGAGIFPSVEDAYSGFAAKETSVHPDAGAHAAYDRLFPLYKKTFNALQEPFKSLASVRI